MKCDVIDDWNLDEKSIGKWYYLQHCKSTIPPKNYNKWRIIFSVGDTKPQLTIDIEQDS